ncbi:hypothetical protein PputUW4_03416 [Pseudomonas sp. UW4]|nr:hypothetical protein PputUW4_03416 [Pseudomonas sp. UW4]
MKEHGINNQQDIHQRLLMNLKSADFETAARMLSRVTTPYEITEKMSQLVRAKSLRALEQEPGEPEDEIIEPASITTTELQVLRCAWRRSHCRV